MNTLLVANPGAASHQRRRLTILLSGIAGTWLAAVIIGAETGALASIFRPVIALIIASTIALPALWYFVSPALRGYLEMVGQRRLMLLHCWRIAAALLFFWYGAEDRLPTLFWALAGTGDLIAGSYALYLGFKPESRSRYLSFHRFGFADFAVAVSTGLTFTLLQDPRMDSIAALPMALVPLFGVGISGASHLMAFDMLRRGVGFVSAEPSKPIAPQKSS